MSNSYIKNDTRKDSPHREILDLIPEGFSNAVSVSELAYRMGLSEHGVRIRIEYAQWDGNIIADIIGPCMDRVCIPANESELNRYVACAVTNLECKIKALNHAYKALFGEQLNLVYRSEDYEE